jgi:hypothetical protein
MWGLGSSWARLWSRSKRKSSTFLATGWGGVQRGTSNGSAVFMDTAKEFNAKSLARRREETKRGRDDGVLPVIEAVGTTAFTYLSYAWSIYYVTTGFCSHSAETGGYNPVSAWAIGF